jgi:hypothetical protein
MSSTTPVCNTTRALGLGVSVGRGSLSVGVGRRLEGFFDRIVGMVAAREDILSRRPQCEGDRTRDDRQLIELVISPMNETGHHSNVSLPASNTTSPRSFFV